MLVCCTELMRSPGGVLDYICKRCGTIVRLAAPIRYYPSPDSDDYIVVVRPAVWHEIDPRYTYLL